MLYVPLPATGKSGRHEPIFRLNCSSPTKAENWSNDISPEAVSSTMSSTAFYTGQFSWTHQAVLVCSIAPNRQRLTSVCTYLWAYIDMNARLFRHDEELYTRRSPENSRGIRWCTYHPHLTLSVPLSLGAHDTWSTGPWCMVTGYLHRNSIYIEIKWRIDLCKHSDPKIGANLWGITRPALSKISIDNLDNHMPEQSSPFSRTCPCYTQL